MRRLAVIILLLLSSLALPAQTTKVRGRVVDASNGEPVPFAAVFFSGSTVGTSTDIDGNYSLTTRNQTLIKLTVSMLGYKSLEVDVSPGAFNGLDIKIVPEENQLSAVTVKADNSRARRLLRNIDRNRDRNNPELRGDYVCDVYSKMEMGLTHPREQLRMKPVLKQWNFIFDYIDTSDVSGVPYLPVMISETQAVRSHTLSPETGVERIVANRLSGADPEGNLLAQFTGSMHLKNNFYSQYINAFNVEIPSPINSSGLLFYNYFIIDSLIIDGRNTYHVRFHPKKGISTPSFDGEMFVDTQDWALRSIKARLVKGQNINWVKDMQLEAQYTRCDDSLWFYKTDRFYADFAIALSDSSQMISVLGNRTLEFSNPRFGEEVADVAAGVVSVNEDAGLQNEEYWSKVRPYELSPREKKTYEMVQRIQDTPLYTTLYDIVYAIINGYWDFEKVGLGPYLKLVSFNPLEGFRMRIGARTSIGFSKKDRIGVYLAYGFRDKEFKGGATWEHLFSKDPTHKLTLDARYDALQLGRGTNVFNDGNLLSSVMGGGRTQKLCMVTEGSALYEKEFSANVNFSTKLMYREFHGNRFVPLVAPSGGVVRSVPTSCASASLRLSRDETVIRGHFIKTYLHTKYPVLTLELTGGAFNLGGTHPYCIPKLSLAWKGQIPPIGMTTLRAEAGTVVGKVPYPLLHIHEGNGTFLLDKTSFSTMNFLEFASDSWATLMLDHNFYGFFLGKIPLLKKLQLREAITFRATWGHLSKRNDGTVPSSVSSASSVLSDSEALLLFPEGMRPLGRVPYIEAGVALTNILRLFRVDFIWRVTHRDDATINPPRNFVVNFGVELRF